MTHLRAIGLLCVGCAGAPTADSVVIHRPGDTVVAVPATTVDLGDFSVTATGPVTTARQEIATPSGQIDSESWVFDGGSAPRRVVVRLDFPVALAQVMDRGESSWPAQFGGLLGVRDESWSHEGFTTSSGEWKGWHHVVHFGAEAGAVRKFWVGDSLFLVAVVGTPPPPLATWSEFAPFTDAQSVAFLGSFRLHPGWRTFRLDSTSTLEVPRQSRQDRSRSGDTTLLRFFLERTMPGGPEFGEQEVCRVFDQAMPASMVDLELARQTLRRTLQGGAVLLEDHALEQHGRQGHEWLVERKTGATELVRLFVSPGHAFLVSTAVESNGHPISPGGQRCLDSFQ